LELGKGFDWSRGTLCPFQLVLLPSIRTSIIRTIVAFNDFTERVLVLHSQFVGKNFIDKLTNKNNSLEKSLLIIYGLSVINLPINL
jgi:hypothetical protein